MTTLAMNQALAEGRTDETGVLPKLDELRPADTVFRYDFGLDSLTEEPGVLILRGARQYGKSTWLQQQIFDTIATFGPGSAYYLDGDEIRNATDLQSEIRTIVALYWSGALVRRLFIDEITSVADWQSALKTLVDRGELSSILVVTTGSQAEDLRRGSERLPGRKGKLAPSSYIFGPVSYSEFATKATGRLDPGDVVPAYVLSGGSPVACAELLVEERLPNYVVELVRDWVNGAFARAGRSRASLLGVLDCLYRFAGSPVGQSKLAREAGLANNTIAAEYIETLSDLLSVGLSHPSDLDTGRPNRRRPSKYHFTNTLVATAWHPRHPRSPADFRSMPRPDRRAYLEWAVAQELFRRAAFRGDELPELLPHRASRDHEIDFVATTDAFIEVKAGKTNPFEFAWFPNSFPTGRLAVVSESSYETDRIRGITFDTFLRGE
jgi:predicted AAA+ superfamily ATPase